ncbi:TetR/AcrR family transcriptional regulator [Curtobacterium citreum]|uniref:TetR/AcrR family transcriptional regulator n=1 Tax=Curtobacterium citreum TaxID=2036 RepID=UPI0007367C6B|nr:TetR/AcrR family transcriptional regulator [Curtobacterium citreum]KTR23734.1 hypothetical protein NS330_03125 [Curtobacterium citreum]
METPRTGRQARRIATRARIESAARELFTQRGYQGTTIRAIGEAAGVDPSLVMQHFGSKGELFAAVTTLPQSNAAEAHQHLLDVLETRLQTLPPEATELLRAMLTVPEAEDVVRTFLNNRIANLASSLDGEDREARAAAAVSSLLGITISRHLLHLDHMQDVQAHHLPELVTSWIGPVPAGTDDRPAPSQ